MPSDGSETEYHLLKYKLPGGWSYPVSRLHVESLIEMVPEGRVRFVGFQGTSEETVFWIEGFETLDIVVNAVPSPMRRKAREYLLTTAWPEVQEWLDGRIRQWEDPHANLQHTTTCVLRRDSSFRMEVKDHR